MRSRRLEAVALASSRVRDVTALVLVVALPLVFDPYSTDPFEAPKVALLRVAVGVMALAHLIERAVERGAEETIRSGASARLDAAVLIYFSTHVLATAFSPDPRLSFWGSGDGHGTATLLCLVVLYFVVSRTLRSAEGTSRLVAAAIVPTVPVALYGIAQFLGLDPLPWETDSVSPVLSTLGRSNFLGAYMAMVVPLTLFSVLAHGPRRLWWVLLLQVLSVVLSQARAAWLALVGGASLFVYLLGRRGRRFRLPALSTAILVLGLLVYAPLSRVDLPSFRNVTGGAAPSFSDVRESSVASRLAIWRCTLSLARDRPLVGHGPETFAAVFAPRCPVAPPGWIVDDPHNVFLEELVAAGVPGAAAFAFLVLCFFSIPVRNALDAALAGSVLAFLIQAQLNPDVIVSSTLFWLALAVARAGSTSDAGGPVEV